MPRSHLLLAALALGAAGPLAAQDSTQCNCKPTQREPNAFERLSSGVFSVIQSRPQGQFGENVGLGYGGSAAYLFALDHQGIFALRADAGFLQYGNESKHVPLSPTIGGRIQVKVSTSNYLVPVMFGPQLTWPSGVIRPYVNAGVGGEFFFTQSHVDGDDDQFAFANTTNQHDATAAWVAGGGVLVPLHQGRTKVLLDVGAQYFAGGHAQYLRPGSIQDLPNNQISVTPFESETRMLVMRVGVKVGLL